MKGRNPTAKEKRHMSATRAIGCIACLNMDIETPEDYTLIHHIDGKTKKGVHFLVLPLCENHHSRYKKTGLHYNLYQWEKLHGSQWDLLEQVGRLIV